MKNIRTKVIGGMKVISPVGTFLLIEISIIIIMLILFYYSVKNTLLLGGTFMNFLRTLGTSVILVGVTTNLLFSYYQIPDYGSLEFILITLVTGVFLIACEQIYYGFMITKKFDDLNMMDMLTSFKFEWFRIAGLLIILFITIPASVGFLRINAEFLNLVYISILIGVFFLAMSERKLNHTLTFVKSEKKNDRKHLSILRDDLLTLNICTDMINSYVDILSENVGKKSLLTIIQDHMKDDSFASDLWKIQNDEIVITRGVEDLKPSNVELNKRNIILYFMDIMKELMGVYEKIFSPETSRESFVEIFHYTKERYGHPVIFRSIMNELPDTIIDKGGTDDFDEDFLENMMHKRAMDMAQSFQKIKDVTEERTAIIESMVDPLIVLDKKNLVTSVNIAYEKVFGFSKDDLLGHELENNTWYNSLDDTYKGDLKKIVYAARKKGKVGPIELQVKNQRGKTKYVTLVASKVSIIRGKEGVLLVFRDISKLKKREKELKILDYALESSINAICIADIEGDILYVNSSFMNLFRYKNRQEILKKSMSEIISQKGPTPNLTEVLSDLGGWMGETKFTRKDGKEFECLIMGTLVKDDTGDPIAYMLSMIDITDKKSSEEWKEFMHSLLVHDVGNKLQIARGYLELILDMDIDDEKKDMASKGLESINSGARLIDKVRLLREVESEVGQGSINPYFILDDVLSTYRDRLESKGIELISNVRKTDAKVRSGSQGGTLIESIFSNLIDNAFKHASCSRIKISSNEDEKYVIISVKDDGKGLSTDIIKELSSDRLISKSQHSRNLGLILATGLTRRLEGRIDIYRSEMGGAGFDVYLRKSDLKT